MADVKQYRLADLSHQVPMPDRGGRLFAQTEEGEAVDVEHAFYRVMIADGDIIPVVASASRDASEASPPVAPAGRAMRRDARSGSRPSAETAP